MTKNKELWTIKPNPPECTEPNPNSSSTHCNTVTHSPRQDSISWNKCWKTGIMLTLANSPLPPSPRPMVNNNTSSVTVVNLWTTYPHSSSLLEVKLRQNPPNWIKLGTWNLNNTPDWNPLNKNAKSSSIPEMLSMPRPSRNGTVISLPEDCSWNTSSPCSIKNTRPSDYLFHGNLLNLITSTSWPWSWCWFSDSCPQSSSSPPSTPS